MVLCFGQSAKVKSKKIIVCVLIEEKKAYSPETFIL